MNLLPWMFALSGLLLAAGAGAAWWGHREFDLDLCYLGVLLIAVAIFLAGLSGCAWLYNRIT